MEITRKEPEQETKALGSVILGTVVRFMDNSLHDDLSCDDKPFYLVVESPAKVPGKIFLVTLDGKNVTRKDDDRDVYCYGLTRTTLLRRSETVRPEKLGKVPSGCIITLKCVVFDFEKMVGNTPLYLVAKDPSGAEKASDTTLYQLNGASSVRKDADRTVWIHDLYFEIPC